MNKTNEETKVAEQLSRLLADSYLLFLKLQNYHWNVKGKLFRAVHVMLEEQYNELFAAIDVIAERITALGYDAPGSFKRFSELASIKEAGDVLSAEDMVKDIAMDHKKVSHTAAMLFSAAEKAGDQVSADIGVQRMASHDKFAWMMNSLLH